jgi:hypothetical protein
VHHMFCLVYFWVRLSWQLHQRLTQGQQRRQNTPTCTLASHSPRLLCIAITEYKL